jgi:hypothetical protein
VEGVITPITIQIWGILRFNNAGTTGRDEENNGHVMKCFNEMVNKLLEWNEIGSGLEVGFHCYGLFTSWNLVINEESIHTFTLGGLYIIFENIIVD